MKVKICHFSSVHPRYDTRIFIKECHSLNEEGYEVFLVVADSKPDEIVDGIKILSVKPGSNKRFTRIFKTARMVYRKALEINADIYHFHDPELLPFAWLMMRKKKKVIYDIHEDVPRDIYSKYWIWKPFRIIVSFLFEIIENRIAVKLSSLITATPYIDKRFNRLNRSVNINNYPIINELASQTKWETKKDKICYIGGINTERGIREVVESLSKTEAVLELAGEFESSQIENEVRKMAGWEKVNFHGHIDRKEAKRIMSECKAGIVTFHPHPNHLNAQPNKIFEYMSAGLPVIGSDFPLWEKIISDCGICVNPMKPEEISDAINYIIENPEIAEKMGERSRKNVEVEYNWENEKQKLINLYKSLNNRE